MSKRSFTILGLLNY